MALKGLQTLPDGTLVVHTEAGIITIKGSEVSFDGVKVLAARGVAVADASAATVGADIAAFTDPPSAAEMAALRTFVNALKVDAASLRVQLNLALARLRAHGLIAT